LFGSDKNKVRITVGSDVDLNGDYELTIANVEDEAGNAISAFDVKAEKLSEEEAPKVSEIRIISKTEIEIVIDKILDKATVEKSDFEVERGSNKVALTRISSITYDDGKTIVKGVLPDAVRPANSGDITGYTLYIEGEIKSDTGKAMATGAVSKSVDDKFAPSFVSVANGVYDASKKGFTLTFDEDIKFLNNSAGLGATDLVIKNGSKTLEAGIDYDVAAIDNKIEVTLKGDNYADFTGTLKVSTKDTVKYITDLAGNALNKFENKEVKVQ